jgi:hypothetical protein
MPLYHFIIDKNGLNDAESIGIELDTFQVAWSEATRCAGEIVRDLDGNLQVGALWKVQVQDQDRKPLQTITIFAENENERDA